MKNLALLIFKISFAIVLVFLLRYVLDIISPVGMIIIIILSAVLVFVYFYILEHVMNLFKVGNFHHFIHHGLSRQSD